MTSETVQKKSFSYLTHLREASNHHGLNAKVKHKIRQHDMLRDLLNGSDGTVEWVNDYFVPGEKHVLDVLSPECANESWDARAKFYVFRVVVDSLENDYVVFASLKKPELKVNVSKGHLALASLDNYGITYGAYVYKVKPKLKLVETREEPECLRWNDTLPNPEDRNIIFHPYVAKALLSGGFKARIGEESFDARARRGVCHNPNFVKTDAYYRIEGCPNPGAAKELGKPY